MPCYLLHMLEMPEPTPYDDPDLKDVVGEFPQFYCAQCSPPRHILPNESARCLEREAPCWRPKDEICPEQEADSPA